MAAPVLTETQVLENLQFEATLTATTPKVFVTYLLIAINVLVFLAMVATGTPIFEPTMSSLVRWGADFGPLTIHADWWRMLTSTFVHIGLLHILMNMYVLFSAGKFTEKLLGNAGFIALYVLSGLGGSLFSLAWHPNTVSAGASGAVFGICGAMLAYVVKQRRAIPRHRFDGITRGFVSFIAVNVLYGITNQAVDMAAHAGGFVVGLLAGCAMALPPEAPAEVRTPRVWCVGLTGVALLIVGAWRLPASDAAQSEWLRQTMTSPSVAMGSDSVLYSGSATRNDAVSLANALKADGVFRDKGISVLLSKGRNGTTISFTVAEETWNAAVDTSEFASFGRQIAPSVGGTPVKVRLYSSDGQLRQEVSAR